MRAQRAGHVGEARLTQRGVVKQSLDKNHLGVMPDLLPRIQIALGAGQKSMREGSADVAAVEVDDVFALAQREDNALIESVRSVHVEQANLPQQIIAIALCREMTAQTSAGGVTDIEFPDQGAIMQPALVEIAHRFGVLIQLLPIESSSLLKHRDRVGFWNGLWIKACEALAERQSAG